MRVPIASCLSPGHDGAAQAGEDAFEILDHGLNSPGFRPEAEQLLFEIEIERKRAGQVIGKRRVLSFWKILLSVGQREYLAVQFDGTRKLRLGGAVWFVLNQQNCAAQKSGLLVNLEEFKTVST